MPADHADTADSASIRAVRGTCHALFAFEVGFSIDLAAAERRIAAQRGKLRQRRRAPVYFEYQPPPLHVTQSVEIAALGRWSIHPSAEIVLYDFGAVAVTYSFALDGDLAGLIDLSEQIYDQRSLLEDAQRRVAEVCRAIQPAISKPAIADVVETYTMFHITEWDPATPAVELVRAHAATFAGLLRSERAALSADEIADATSHTISYGIDDLVLVDWDAALLFGSELDDVRAVLEFANVQLLEMRYLDRQLDDALGGTYPSLSRSSWRKALLDSELRSEVRRIAELQVDSAILFEGVNNALKLLGDQYLARAYRLAADRFHLSEWDASILRKLGVLESIYQKLSDTTTARRLEVLEWIIIILIALSIVVMFLPIGAH